MNGKYDGGLYKVWIMNLFQEITHQFELGTVPADQRLPLRDRARGQSAQ